MESEDEEEVEWEEEEEDWGEEESYEGNVNEAMLLDYLIDYTIAGTGNADTLIDMLQRNPLERFSVDMFNVGVRSGDSRIVQCMLDCNILFLENTMNDRTVLFRATTLAVLELLLQHRRHLDPGRLSTQVNPAMALYAHEYHFRYERPDIALRLMKEFPSLRLPRKGACGDSREAFVVYLRTVLCCRMNASIVREHIK
jgi:hypothetical protein